MAYSYNYQIGASIGGLVNVEALTGLLRPPRGFFYLYPVEYVIGDSSTVGEGMPTAKWVYDSISRTGVGALRAFLVSGSTYLLSAPVYIHTKLDDDISYATFLAVMHWPRDFFDKKVPGSKYFQALEILFTNLVQQ
jgi:hypothetical protein